MKLYICADGSYVGTQADAKAKGKGWIAEEVPVDKQGLIDYLNKNRHLYELECPEPAAHDETRVISATEVTLDPPAAAATWGKAPKPGDPAEAIADWLYREADDHYVYEVMTAIGSRIVNKARRDALLT